MDKMHRYSFPILLTLAFLGCQTYSRGEALNYSTSWIGDSFFDCTTNPPTHIPDWLGDVAVAPDGTVFTAGYAEWGGGGASYKDGLFAGRYDGFGTGFGSPVDAVAADANWVYFGGSNGIQRYARGGGGTPNQSLLPKTIITGLAVSHGSLYASDYSNNKIHVFALDTLKETASFPAVRPGKIAVDHTGQVWVIQLSPSTQVGNGVFPGEKVVSFSSNGVPGPSIDDVVLPSALAVDDQNELLVGNSGPDCRIRYYGDLGTHPKLVRTFGSEGGLSSAPAGVRTPGRFHWIHGVALDAAGNLYVACVYGIWWGQTVEAYSPGGQLKWQVSGTDYCDSGAIDPRSETDVFDSIHHYVLDYDKPAGKQWQFVGLTTNDVKYPDDLRVTQAGGGFRQGIGIRYIHGRKFLLVSDQSGYPLWIYRFSRDTDGETAIPSAAFLGGGPDKIACDTNGDGKFEPDEIQNGAPGYFQYSHMTDDGDVWRIGADGAAAEYPLQGIDKNGNPIYTAQSAVIWPIPPDFDPTGAERTRAEERGTIRSLTYDKASDTMWMGGSHWPEYNGGLVHICCYDHWKSAGGHARSTSWNIRIPFNDTSYTPQTGSSGGTPLVMRIAGKYMFVCYGMGYVRIHDKETGAYIGTLIPHLPGYDGGGGQVDSAYGMTAMLRSNGEYVVLTESAGCNHIVMMRWRPSP
jgi:hypothetical protein